ncbi:TetR/AcrR family transcriptional regulator [Streptomyces sp. NPDC102364]|uniref:TetR/AcrR family transcriptional regulator n=1 Tax=Streptomyces sp. NPDC102364 TaxID=3366161 RepID=UPI00380E89B6
MDQKPARVRIVEAAHELMLSIGLARTTTKEIAKAAGCSEAALYKYFANKEELFVTVLNERLPKLGSLLGRLLAEGAEGAEGAGGPGRTVEQNLTEIAREAALFYEQTFPMAASLYAEPKLKRRHEEVMRELGTGPHKPIQGLDAYLRAEQKSGRISAEADTYAAASLLLGACSQRAFAYEMSPDGRPPQPVDEFAAHIARTLLSGIA